jgi:hypothetical protein
MLLLLASMALTATPWALDRDCIIVIPKNDYDGNIAIRLAVLDIQRDFYKVIGAPPVVVHELPQTNSPTRPWLLFGRPSSAPWLYALSLEPQCVVASDPEAHTICTRHITVNNGTQKVVASLGHDTRGAIFASYAFSEVILGVLPLWFFADCDPPYRGLITIPSTLKIQFSADGFQHRAFFFNDEDLLGGFAKDPAGRSTLSISMYDALFEALLRLKGNAVIPGTAPFPDEPSLALATRRGLVLSQHHVTVCGLNTYRWPSPPATSTIESSDQVTERRVWLPCVLDLRLIHANFPPPYTLSQLGSSLQLLLLQQPQYYIPRVEFFCSCNRQMANFCVSTLRKSANRYRSLLWLWCGPRCTTDSRSTVDR